MKRSLMPRWMTALLAAVLLAACAAPGEEAPIEEPSLPEQSLSQEAETPVSQEEPAQEPSQEEASSQADSQLPAADAFYPSMATYRDYEGSALPGSVLRNRDGTLTFQHENTLNVLSPDNRLLQAMTMNQFRPNLKAVSANSKTAAIFRDRTVAVKHIAAESFIFLFRQFYSQSLIYIFNGSLTADKPASSFSTTNGGNFRLFIAIG